MEFFITFETIELHKNLKNHIMPSVALIWVMCRVKKFCHENYLRSSSVSEVSAQSVEQHWRTADRLQAIPNHTQLLCAGNSQLRAAPSLQKNRIPRHTISFIGFLCLPVSIIIVFCVPGRVIMLVTRSAEMVFLS